MGEKVGFTNCVFEKLCFSESTILKVFSEKHSRGNTNTVCKQKAENWWKNVGCFEHGKRVFFVCFLFQALISLCFCLVKLQECKKACFFASFLGRVGWLLLVYLDLEGLGVFVFFVFAFPFGVGFVFVCLLCFVLWLDVVVSVSVFFCVFCCLCLFVFVLEGLRVRWGGPKGHLTWPYTLQLLFFVFLFGFFCFPFFV